MGRMLHEAESVLPSRQTLNNDRSGYPSLSTSDPNARTDPAPELLVGIPAGKNVVVREPSPRSAHVDEERRART